MQTESYCTGTNVPIQFTQVRQVIEITKVWTFLAHIPSTRAQGAFNAFLIKMCVVKNATTKIAQKYPNQDNLLLKYQSAFKNSKVSKMKCNFYLQYCRKAAFNNLVLSSWAITSSLPVASNAGLWKYKIKTSAARQIIIFIMK